MIKHRWFKGAGYMTDTAVLRGRDVDGGGRIFLGSNWRRRWIITVTGCTVIHNTRVIKGTIGEIVANCMARSTIGGRDRMRIS